MTNILYKVNSSGDVEWETTYSGSAAFHTGAAGIPPITARFSMPAPTIEGTSTIANVVHPPAMTAKHAMIAPEVEGSERIIPTQPMVAKFGMVSPSVEYTINAEPMVARHSLAADSAALGNIVNAQPMAARFGFANIGVDYTGSVELIAHPMTAKHSLDASLVYKSYPVEPVLGDLIYAVPMSAKHTLFANHVRTHVPFHKFSLLSTPLEGGAGSNLKLSTGMGIPLLQNILFQIGQHATILQVLSQSLSRGDFVSLQSSLSAGLVQEIQKAQHLLASMVDPVTVHQKGIHSLSAGELASKISSIFASLVSEITKVQVVAYSHVNPVFATQKATAGLLYGETVSQVAAIQAALVSEAIKRQYLSFANTAPLAVLQKITNQLLQGDITSIQSVLTGSLVEEIQKAQHLSVAYTDPVYSLQMIRESLLRGDTVQAFALIASSLVSDAQKNQHVSLSYTDQVNALQAIFQTISADALTVRQSQPISLLPTNEVRALQNLSVMMADPYSLHVSTASEIYLDGLPVSDKVQDIRISYDESTVHNEITFSGIGREMFDWADPAINYGEVRIEVQIGNRIIHFLLDSREGDEQAFTISGISVSAKEDMPYYTLNNLPMDFLLEAEMGGPTLASEVASSLTSFCPVEWQAYDYLVPGHFAFEGPPIVGIMRLAAEIGAIVRCQDDGSLVVRNKRPVRPVNMDSTAADTSYDMTHLITLSHSEEPESGYNAVRVTGQSSEVHVPQVGLEPIEVPSESPDEDPQTRGPYIGETCYMRVFWGDTNKNVIDTYVTDGSISQMAGGAVYHEDIDDIVDFKDGIGSVGYPIDALVSYEWIGDSGGSVSFDRHGRDFTIANGRFRIAKIKYRIAYQRYRLSDHEVERMLAVLFLSTKPDIIVDVKIPAAPVFGSPIDAHMLSDPAAAVARGTAWIDEQYRKSNIQVSSPYRDEALDGATAYINDAYIGNPGNYHITGADIVISGPVITNELKVEKCLTSFRK